ncbi:DUF397 domain-containing protein [Actinomadura gamaensis]|uniref:DUF397 domain-containing protein n=1 Tax=Actinomadura gamaensis TaxID=1763541 RepID=A0ABV9U656_9ACTN
MSDGGGQVLFAWRRSSYSDAGGANCVELAELGMSRVGLRDSKAPAAGYLSVPVAELKFLLGHIRRDDMDAVTR